VIGERLTDHGSPLTKPAIPHPQSFVFEDSGRNRPGVFLLEKCGAGAMDSGLQKFSCFPH